MGLSRIVSPYLKKGKTGVLSIKLKDESHLLKIYVEDGDVIYITLGTLKNEGCFKRLKEVEPVEHFFLQGVKAPGRAEGGLTTKFLESLEGSDATVLTKKAGVEISADDVKKVEAEFIDVIGPIAKVIVDEYFSKIGYVRDDPMPEEEYHAFLDTIIRELPPSEQVKFRTKYQ